MEKCRICKGTGTMYDMPNDKDILCWLCNGSGLQEKKPFDYKKAWQRLRRWVREDMAHSDSENYVVSFMEMVRIKRKMKEILKKCK